MPRERKATLEVPESDRKSFCFFFKKEALSFLKKRNKKLFILCCACPGLGPSHNPLHSLAIDRGCGTHVSSRVVSPGLQRPGMECCVDRPYRHHLDDARPVRRHGPQPGARLLRLPPAGGFLLCRRELRRLHRDLPSAGHRRAAPGPLGGGGADGAGDVADRHRSDLRHLRLSPLPAGPPDGDARPGLGGPHRLERGHRQLRLRGDEFRPGRHARARPALRHGGRIHGGRQQAVGIVGARRHHRRHARAAFSSTTPRSTRSTMPAASSGPAARSIPVRARRAGR